MPPIAREVVSNLLSRATSPLNPSIIKETVVRKQPDFDERDHGFSSFSRLLEAMEKEGLLSLQQQGRQCRGVARGRARQDRRRCARGRGRVLLLRASRGRLFRHIQRRGISALE